MFGSLKPGIHCAISVRFPCDFSKVSTQTVREDRMRCNSMLTIYVLLSRAYTVRFSSDFEPNSDSCDCFLSRAEFQLCRASFVVQCSFSVQAGNRTVG